MANPYIPLFWGLAMETYGFCALPWELSASHLIGQLFAIAGATPGEREQLAERMDAYLRSHPTVSGWQGHRPRLRDTPHFAYSLEETKGSRYQRAIDTLIAGTASIAERELVRALGMEIAGSSLVIRPKQVLLSGRLTEPAISGASCDQFLWATIHPVSAVEQAESLHPNAARTFAPTVHVLHLERELPALLGRRISHRGHDLLLPRSLRVEVFATHQTSSLTVKEVFLSP